MIAEDFKTRGTRSELERDRDQLQEYVDSIESLIQDIILGATRYNHMVSFILEHAERGDIRLSDPVDITDALGDLASLKYYLECERGDIEQRMKSAIV